MPTVEQWRSTWAGLGAPAPEGLFERLVECYAEPHRRYHTAQHLDECFAAFSSVRSAAACPEEIELALWLHDAIYDTKRKDNEQKSAEWARSAMLGAGLSEGAAERVHALVMATRHAAIPSGNDAEILVDVDLSILGDTPQRFAEYERQVRAEYAWVPDALYRRTRRKILKGFLRRRSIYATEHFRAARERLARKNLRRSVERLRTGLEAGDILLLAATGAWTVAGLVLRVPIWIVVAVALAASVAYAIAVDRLRRSRWSPSAARGATGASRYAVHCGDDGIAVSLDGVQRETVRWDDIVIVGIRIDDSFLPQPWWVVGGASGGCMYPSDADGWAAALAELQQRLPGFDNEVVIRAAGMTSGGVVVWEKSAQR
jgi:predicted metal-dependent HD superfamily phosphohydrolase